MINSRMFQNINDLTEFSTKLALKISNTGPVMVKTRSGAWYEVVRDKEGEENQCFHTKNWALVWNNDGSSIKNRDLDIVEADI